jgi:2-polyprenyl-6-methoxyphenol hydroxylase-like FAD-dependent oxidoreductase
MSTTTSSSPPRSVTIIGAGLSGLTLALALNKYGIRSKLIELRNPEYDFGGAIMMSPNALRVLDSLEVYKRILPKGFTFDVLTFKNDADQKTTGMFYFGQRKMYGYDGLRIYRRALLTELCQMAHEQGIPIEYERKFSHVISEDEHGVKFALADGTEELTELLVGADGIHSKVRQYLAPDVAPLYSGFVSITYAFPRSKLRFPSDQTDYPLPISLHGKGGAFVMAPQSSDGNEIFAGRQFAFPMQERSGWEALLKDKSKLIEMHQRDMGDWSDFTRSGQEQISSPDAHSITTWPFHTVPKLKNWSSDGGKVILIGDAAHAIPPTTGQGANQAFEDAHSLAILLSSLTSEITLSKGLKLWQSYRQAKVDKLLELTEQMNNLRLPEAEKKLLPKEKIWQGSKLDVGAGGQLSWLYSTNIEADMAQILSSAS